ncbi:D-alanyl-D-alanine carboxypeptidase [Candidatus Parcubacteria bacterium]|nr:MAG: D-alanyl-D-alanine carboxypeptidase [Candidatus Parcubacteria bacterium]
MRRVNMVLKAISQLILAVGLLQIAPVDASYFELSAGVAKSGKAVAAVDVMDNFAILPQAGNRFNYPVKVDKNSYGIVTTAVSALVVDRDSGAILFQKNAGAVRSIGSVTKLMAALVFLDQNPNLSQTVVLEADKDYVGGGHNYLRYYDGVKLKDVLAAGLIGSDNTAINSLVRFSGLSREEFVNKMNEKARDLDMKDSVFADPTGIDADNMSTARDIVKLLAAAEKSEIIKFYTEMPKIKIIQDSGRAVEIKNTNKLLDTFLNQGDYKVIGGKTGYLPEAGYVLATTVEENDHAVHIVVMGSESKKARIDEAKGLAYWAFKTFKWQDDK